MQLGMIKSIQTFKGIRTRGVYCVEVVICELGNMVNKITMWVYLCFHLGKPIKTPAILFVLNELRSRC